MDAPSTGSGGGVLAHHEDWERESTASSSVQELGQSRSHRRRRHRCRHSRSNSRSRSRSNSRRRRHRTSGFALCVISDDEEVATVEKPVGDWGCGICSNLNSSQRDVCFRCTATYRYSKTAVPSCEVCIESVAPDLKEMDIADIIRSVLREHGEERHLLRTARNEDTVYVRFASPTDAMRTLMYMRCSLNWRGTDYPMRFSSDDYTSISTDCKSVLEADPVEVAAPVGTLPMELFSRNWTPPTNFDTPEEERKYLALLSEHWQHLTVAQKAYYDNRVASALKARKITAEPTPPPTLEVKPTTESSLSSRISALGQRVAAKRRAQQPQSHTAAPSVSGTADSAPSLVSPQPDGSAVKHLFGFPVPPCVNPSGITTTPMVLHYVPYVTMERVVPPCARQW